MSGLVCPEGYFPGDLAGESKCRPCNIICRKGSNLSDERLCQTFKTCKDWAARVLYKSVSDASSTAPSDSSSLKEILVPIVCLLVAGIIIILAYYNRKRLPSIPKTLFYRQVKKNDLNDVVVGAAKDDETTLKEVVPEPETKGPIMKPESDEIEEILEGRDLIGAE